MISTEEQEALLQSTKSYADTYLAKGVYDDEGEVTSVTPSIASDLYLYTVADELNRRIQAKEEILACLTEPMCNCAAERGGEAACDCDHDLSVKLDRVVFEVGSNCSFVLNFQFNEPMNQEMDKKLKREQEELNFRIFHLDEKSGTETSLIYVSRELETPYIQFTMHEPHLTFDTHDEKISTIYKDLSIRINYLHYQTEEQLKRGSKFSM